MPSCSSVCRVSCVRQHLVYTFFVGSYLFNALTYQVHIWCEDTLGQQLQIAYMYVGVRGQGQRSNSFFCPNMSHIPLPCIFMCSYLFNALTYQVHIWCEDTLGQQLQIAYMYVGVRGQGQRSNSFFGPNLSHFPLPFIFMCPQHLNGLSYPIHICFRSKVVQIFVQLSFANYYYYFSPFSCVHTF